MRAIRTRVGPRAGELSVHYGASLRVVGGGKTIPLGDEGVTIGTGKGNELVVDDPYVSKRHCHFLWSGELLMLRDLDSRNGTWVNNVRVTHCRLGPRARIDVGRTRLQIIPAVEPEDGPNVHGLVGSHSLMLAVSRRIDRFAAGSFPVLIRGETGTGKELVARALHEASAVASGPFEALNCAAIPRELAESELFGHVRGAFTGAVSPFAGAFQRAEGGTLFLDEVGEMPLELQPKLLRVLEDGFVRPVGGERSEPVNVRLVAATHRDLAADAKRKRFRQDLFYRLCVGLIELPPLRERASDIPALVRHFVAAEACQGKVPRLERGLARWLAERPWPGNVRALRHAVQRAMALREGPLLRRDDFDDDIDATAGRPGELLLLEGKSFFELKREIFQWALDNFHNRAAAARALDMAKSTFNDQLRTLKLI